MIKAEPPVIQWQTISAFPKYEINEHGDVRDINSRICVTPARFKDVSYVELMREEKPFLNQVRRLVQETFPTGANPYSRTPFERHGEWDKSNERYADGENSHLCGMVCSVGEV